MAEFLMPAENRPLAARDGATGTEGELLVAAGPSGDEPERQGRPGLSRRVLAARWLAFTADVMQILILPAFGAGALSPITDLLDVLVAAAMLWLVGWHAALLPTLILELIPVADLFPTWTAAVLFVTRKR